MPVPSSDHSTTGRQANVSIRPLVSVLVTDVRYPKTEEQTPKAAGEGARPTRRVPIQ